MKNAKLKTQDLTPVLPVLLVLLFFYLGCAEKTVQENTESNKYRQAPEQTLKNFTAYESQKGKKIWDLVAEQAQIFESEKRVLLNDFRVRFYESGGKLVISSVLTARNGEIDTVQNNFKTIGETLVTTADDEILECRDLYYVSKRKKIYTDSKVKLTRKDSVITGVGLEATPDLSIITIKENLVEIREKK